MTKKQNSNVLAIGVMFLLFFMIAFVTNFAGSMGVIVKNQFGATNAMSQLGTLANFIAYACMGIPAGIILKRKGYKFTSLLAVVIGIIGVGIQLASGYVDPSIAFGVYVLGAFIAGFTMCMLNIVVNPMLNTLGGGGNRGNQLIQLGGSCNSIGGTIAPILVGYLIGGSVDNATVADAVPGMIIAISIFVLAFIIIGLSDIPEPHMETAEEKAARKVGNVKKDKYSPMSFRHFVLGAIAIFFYVGVEVGIPNMANLFMTTPTTEQAQTIIAEYNKQQQDAEYLAQCKAADESNKDVKGYEPTVISEANFEKANDVATGESSPGLGMLASLAGWLVGAYWFMMMCGRLIGSAIGAKVSSKSMLNVACIIALGFVFCVMYIPATTTMTIPFIEGAIPVKFVFMLLCGLCTSVMWGGIFNLAVEGLGKYTPAASGIFMTLVCGGGILPFVQGLVADSIGFAGSYWVIVAGLAYMLFYALVGSKNVNKDIPVE